MRRLWGWLFWLMIAVRWWRLHMVARALAKPVPPPPAEPPLVSLIQPILSGDPTLEAGLRANLTTQSHYPREWLWLIDTNDPEAQAITARLCAAFPEQRIHVIAAAPPPERTNPKTFKLIAGLAAAEGEIIAILDDDTRLPDDGLAACLPLLDEPDVGLVFGVPYYVSFTNVWSALIALFVNGHSLVTYLPYAQFREPFTINGMFYALRREVLEELGGFSGIEHILADDFAVAQRVHQGGYRLAQTGLRHGISTFVPGPRRYLSLMQRWFIFPRESLLRHLPATDKALLAALAAAPTLYPLGLLMAPFMSRTPGNAARLSTWLILSLGEYIWLDRRYLNRATPTAYLPLVPLVELAFPLQLLAALAAPQRINWRGHQMEVERGGGFRFVRRRTP